MRKWGSAALALLLAAGFFALTASNHDPQLERRLDRSEERLQELHTQQKILSLESGLRLCRLEEKLDLAGLAIVELRDRLKTEAPSSETLRREILFPSVQVSGKGGVGGGTILTSRPRHTYIITAFHVLQKITLDDEDSKLPKDVAVKVYDPVADSWDHLRSTLLAWDAKKDLALLRLETPKIYANTARLATREALRKIRVFTPIYAVGCPLGHDPLPTPGEIASLRKEVDGEKFWMMNAPTIFGNSGGGVFHRETCELIGVSAMICTYDGLVSTPVPHLGILVSLETVYAWLDALGRRYAYDPSWPLPPAATSQAPAPRR